MAIAPQDGMDAAPTVDRTADARTTPVRVALAEVSFVALSALALVAGTLGLAAAAGTLLPGTPAGAVAALVGGIALAALAPTVAYLVVDAAVGRSAGRC